MPTTKLGSTVLFFASFTGLALAGFFVGCLFTATETTHLKFVDSSLVLFFLFNSAKNFRAALVELVSELEILRRTCR